MLVAGEGGVGPNLTRISCAQGVRSSSCSKEGGKHGGTAPDLSLGIRQVCVQQPPVNLQKNHSYICGRIKCRHPPAIAITCLILQSSSDRSEHKLLLAAEVLSQIWLSGRCHRLGKFFPVTSRVMVTPVLGWFKVQRSFISLVSSCPAVLCSASRLKRKRKCQ